MMQRVGRGPFGRRWWGVIVSAALGVGVLPTLITVSAAPAVAASTPGAEVNGAAVSEDEALAKAKKSGEPVEVLSQRGESSEVYATPQGDLEAREYLRPVWTRQSGGWKHVDTDLAVTEQDAVAPKATTVDLQFSNGGDKAPLVRLERAGRELSLSWPKALPKPELSGAVATYPSVLPDVDLRMTAQEDGFSQLLVVKTAEAAASSELAEVRLKLAADGMDVKETAEGGLEAIDKGAKGAVFEAPKPMMWDSSPGEAPAAKTLSSSIATTGADGEPGAGESGKLTPVDVHIPDDQSELVLTPDQDVLTGQGTHYPVFIDPQWYSPRASAWTMASKYWASSPQYKFNGDSDAGMGYCNWSYCQPHDTKRLFYRIPVSKFAGKSILSAEFVARNTWSASCSDRSVELWQTKGISSSTTWNSQSASGFWIKQLASKSFAYGYSGCSAKDAEFSVKSAVQSAANAHDSTMTFGLRAGSESDAYAWKRFSDKAYLRVKYNRPPAQLKSSQLTMEYGGTCKPSSNPARVRTLGKITANNVTDPDGDSVAVQFQAKWDGGSWSPSKSTMKSSGSNIRISLPSTIPQNKTVNWYARVYDGAQYSPWSYAGDPQACYFIYDTSVPKAPSVVSGQYPESNPDDPDDPWYDGVGQYGSFTIDSASTDVTTYRYGINTDPSSKNKITTSGGAPQIAQVLPAETGVNFVTAQAFDSAGNGSEIRTYQFRVKAGQPSRATWQMDEAAGASEAKGSTPARTLALHGGATPGVEGANGTAVQFNGTDAYASTDLSPVNTSGGFAVSAWVKLDKLPTATADVALIPGNNASGMELYYSTTYGWSFNQYKSDDASSGMVRAHQGDTSKVKADTWTHLVGSYSSTEDLLQLYVDGQLADSVSYDAPWTARRGLLVGAKNFTGTPSALFPGAIDELQIFDKPLAQDEVDKLKAKQSVGDPGRPAIALFDMDEAADATELAGHGGVLPAKYNGTVSPGMEGIAGKATKFDGTSGYAKIGQTSGPHINTERSFTVSSWAKLDKKPAGAAVITAQAGKAAPGFELYYSATYDRWAFNQYSSDSADAKPVRAMQADGTSARAGEWVHLVGVHDTTANTLTLYVNGVKAGTQTLTDAFYADQSMYIGASSYGGAMGAYFPGTIDDVRVMDRPASAEEVAQMYRQRPLVKARWNFETVTDATPATSPDSSDNANTMTLGGQAQQGTGWVDFNGLQLDGVDDYASSKSQPLDTSASFTVTAWAQAAALPTGNASVVSAAGTHTSAFDLHFTPDSANADGMGSYSADIRTSDTAGAGTDSVSNTEFYDARDWNHLALVYDGFAKEARLYVNGVLQETACSDADGNGDADDSGCQDLIAWADNVLAFKADGTLQVGRAKTADAFGQYFPGVIDDVWTFQGALSDAQIEQLAISWFDVPTEVPGN
ncbi:LamG domain-containing protein [Streptomyces sp. NBC_00006]|uniref:LamG domain-containing protein n=1 Tax=Streptomyces sp. NBC_00006 TaxID=2975619 RepID=UPI00224E3275|nr:LamG domain-containing protein [Streptomyces sp. NBC_00006]MCX5535760.1 LamG domain-containing protein [Streptomyces sp. NBC_00006]